MGFRWASENGLQKMGFRKWASENGLQMGFRWASDGLQMGFRKWASDGLQMGFRWASVAPPLPTPSGPYHIHPWPWRAQPRDHLNHLDWLDHQKRLPRLLQGVRRRSRLSQCDVRCFSTGGNFFRRAFSVRGSPGERKPVERVAAKSNHGGGKREGEGERDIVSVPNPLGTLTEPVPHPVPHPVPGRSPAGPPRQGGKDFGGKEIRWGCG